MAARQFISDQLERTPAKRSDAAATRLQRVAAPAIAGGRIDPRGLTPQSVLHLQRTAGNTAVNSLLSGRSAGGTVVQRAAEEEESVQAMGAAQYEAVQRHHHHVPPQKQGTNVWNTGEEED